MKTENTPANKARFFALYCMQKVYRNQYWVSSETSLTVSPYILGSTSGISLGYLELTPLSQISDEDAVEVAKIFHVYEENDTPEQRKLIILTRFPRHLSEHLEFIDYVRSRGYYVGDGTEIEYGWAVLKTT